MSESDSDMKGGPAVPRGVLRADWRERGGEELERSTRSGETLRAVAAVDVRQFRNEEVGKGYQARHVVRQPRATPADVKIVDMSSSKSNVKDTDERKRKYHPEHPEVKKSRPEHPEVNESNEKKSSRRRRYLQCDALRGFRKELEKIV
jgi:hypothetical protein